MESEQDVESVKKPKTRGFRYPVKGRGKMGDKEKQEQAKREYELALRTGRQRFGRPCTHSKTRNGCCVLCMRNIKTTVLE